MAEIREDTAGRTRDLPISEKLHTLLSDAADACNVDTVRVVSGGQCPKGECEKRTGSTRHDNGMAADLQLIAAGQYLDFTSDEGQKTVALFVRECAKRGATGIGAGVEYMGPRTLHVGYGSRAYWGAGGKAANAPAWLGEAVKGGWNDAISAENPQKPFSKTIQQAPMDCGDSSIDFSSDDEELETDWKLPDDTQI